jgi:hypothetical protein
MKGKRWTILASLHPRKVVVMTVLVFVLLGIALHAARTQDQSEGAIATGATTQSPSFAGVVSSAQNPLQIALLHWYDANLTAQFPNPYGVANEGASIWVADNGSLDQAYAMEVSLYTQIGKALSASMIHREMGGLQTLHALESKIAERGVGDPEATYKIAQAYAVLGDKASALRILRRSVESGFFCYPYFTTDPLLNILRGEPEFKSILEIARLRHESFKRVFF